MTAQISPETTEFYLSLPFSSAAENAPWPSPTRFLHDFAQWIVDTTDEATLQLERMEHDAEIIDIRGVVAAEQGRFNARNSPFRANGSFSDDHAETMEEFFAFHLAKARLEHLLRRRKFFRQMVWSFVMEDEFDELRREQFETLFDEFLANSARYKRQFDASGITVDQLIESMERTPSEPVSRDDVFAMWGVEEPAPDDTGEDFPDAI